jgi:hypothetical protein
MSSPAFGLHKQYPADGVYTVVKAMTLSGLKLNSGDALPTDHVIRQNSQRLEKLCTGRFLQLSAGTLGAIEVAKPQAPQPKTRKRK